MKNELFSRLVPLIGDVGYKRLQKARVVVVGLGGVGGACAEALSRSGVGRIDLVDGDIVRPSNMNRQIVALHSTIDAKKADVMKARILDINPDCDVRSHPFDYDEENRDELLAEGVDFVFDAIDSFADKVDLIVHALKKGIPVLTSCGMGNRLNPDKIVLTDLFETDGDPLARKLRKALRKESIDALPVVFSTEKPLKKGSGPPYSSAFVPPAAGIRAAAHIVKTLIEE